MPVLLFGGGGRGGFIKDGFVGCKVEDHANFLVVGAMQFCLGKMVYPAAENQVDYRDDLGRCIVGTEGNKNWLDRCS
jgi:hypothetical protein